MTAVGRRTNEKSLANLRPFQKGDDRTRELAARGGRASKKPKVTEILRAKAEERADDLLRPYFEGLTECPHDEWSPSKRLDFYAGQVAIAERLLDRVDGKPVARHRHVGGEDDDGLDGLSASTVVQLVAALCVVTE